MLRKPILIMAAVLILSTLACGMPRPVEKIKTGPTETQSISIPTPKDGTVVELELTFGAGELNLEPGAEDAFLTGTAKYNVEEFKPDVTSNGDTVSVRQGNLENGHFFGFDGDIKNEWNLQLDTTPIQLRITAGAYQGRYEFGGLAIEKLIVQDGAADVDLNFASPNLIEMSLLRYETGASNVELRGLANANFSEMEFRSGAGDYTLDFSGELQRDAEVTIESGISSVKIIVPEDMSVKLVFEGGLSSVNANGNWLQNGSKYTQSGSGPTLTINVKMGAGSLELDNP